jgi:hypothetical protein
MPNGHGPVPYFGGPILCAISFAFFVCLPFGDKGWPAWARFCFCMVLAAAIGWRVAYYVHMYEADNYGGAYTPPEVYRRASRHYWIAAPFYSVLTAAAGLGVLWWCGLP